MADKIDLEENSPFRVALDLARQIAHNENKMGNGDRAYWLDLYERCRRVVYKGSSAADALK